MKAKTFLAVCVCFTLGFSLFAEERAEEPDLFEQLQACYQIADLENDTLIMRVTPYSRGPKTAVFTIAGLKAEAEPYNSDLGWF